MRRVREFQFHFFPHSSLISELSLIPYLKLIPKKIARAGSTKSGTLMERCCKSLGKDCYFAHSAQFESIPVQVLIQKYRCNATDSLERSGKLEGKWFLVAKMLKSWITVSHGAVMLVADVVRFLTSRCMYHEYCLITTSLFNTNR